MPVDRGSSNKAREKNIQAEIAAGKPVKQAVAIGYSEQRSAMKKSGHKHSMERGYHGHHSHGVGTDGGSAGSHDHTNAGGHRAHIHTGHPDELERFNESPPGGHGK